MKKKRAPVVREFRPKRENARWIRQLSNKELEELKPDPQAAREHRRRKKKGISVRD